MLITRRKWWSADSATEGKVQNFELTNRVMYYAIEGTAVETLGKTSLHPLEELENLKNHYCSSFSNTLIYNLKRVTKALRGDESFSCEESNEQFDIAIQAWDPSDTQVDLIARILPIRGMWDTSFRVGLYASTIQDLNRYNKFSPIYVKYCELLESELNSETYTSREAKGRGLNSPAILSCKIKAK